MMMMMGKIVGTTDIMVVFVWRLGGNVLLKTVMWEGPLRARSMMMGCFDFGNIVKTPHSDEFLTFFPFLLLPLGVSTTNPLLETTRIALSL